MKNLKVKKVFLMFLVSMLGIGMSLNCVSAYQWSDYYQDDIYYDSNSKLYYSVSGNLVTIEGIAEGVKNVTIPSSIKGKTVTTLTMAAFSPMYGVNSTLQSVSIPDTVSDVQFGAFQDCINLITVKLPKKLKTLNSYAFKGCKSLKEITVTSDLDHTAIFDDCSSLEVVKFSDDVKNLQYLNSMFNEGTYNLKKIYIPNSVINISSYLKNTDINNATIYCMKDSYTHNFCVTKGINYQLMDVPFYDVDSKDWFYNSVKYTYDHGIIAGVTATSFDPNSNLSRGMLATILWRMDGAPTTSGGRNFPDVSSSDYFYNAIKWATSKGVVNGYTNGKFGPNDNITREQLAVMLRNYALYKGKSVSSNVSLSRFKDGNKVSEYAKSAMNWAVENKIVSGKNNGTLLDPIGTASRAEAAAMICNYCSNVK